MTDATTRQAIRRDLYYQIPGLGFNSTADSIAATRLTDAFQLADSTLGANAYRGMYIYRPSMTTDDRVKKIATGSGAGGYVDTGGSAYVDQSTFDYEIVGLMHPDELNACIQRAMRRIYFETQVPLCGRIVDGDMDSASTDWTPSSANITLSKITSNVYSGIRALRGVNTVANEYAYSNTIPGFANTNYFAFATAYRNSGTANFVVYDVANSAPLVSLTASDDNWVEFWAFGQSPASCDQLRIQLTGVETTADITWNHAGIYRMDETGYPAPFWLDEQYKFLKLRQAMYKRTISGQTNGGYNDAHSRVWEDWAQPSMFSLDPLHIDTNPYTVNLVRPIPQAELWIEGKRPFADLEPLNNDTDTTHAPLQQTYAYAKQEIAMVLMKRYPNDKRWATLMQEAMAEVIAETQARPETPMQPIHREVWTSI